MKWQAKVLIVLLAILLPSSSGVPGDGAKSWLLDDFEDRDLEAASGLAWFPLADDMIGGASEVRLESRPGGAAGSRHALRLTGRLGAGRRSFAGAPGSSERPRPPAQSIKASGVPFRMPDAADRARASPRDTTC